MMGKFILHFFNDFAVGSLFFRSSHFMVKIKMKMKKENMQIIVTRKL